MVSSFKFIVFSFPSTLGAYQIILDKCSDVDVAIFYLKKTIQNNWSRDTLRAQMKQNLYERQGTAITNFE
jgi:predicted nuclease of restriction endonuclease-like (RecB) superfamily